MDRGQTWPSPGSGVTQQKLDPWQVGGWAEAGATVETQLPSEKLPEGFPGGPVVKTLHFHAGGLGSTPGMPCSTATKKKKEMSHEEQMRINTIAFSSLSSTSSMPH